MMKKIAYLTLLLIVVSIISCKKNDTTPPVITLQGTNPDIVTFASQAVYTDPGATVIDDFDGTLSYTTSGSVNMYSAGKSIITYSAMDAAKNASSSKRTVIINAAPYISGFFTVSNYIISTFDVTYIDTLSVAIDTTNIINFKRFGTYVNANVYGTIAGTTITIPQQTILCGIPAHSRTFEGAGSFSSDSVFTINYTISDTSLVYSAHGDYVRN